MARRAIKKSVRFDVFKRDSFTCQYCGQKAPEVVLEIDHITPVSDGGGNDILNLVTSCRDCNSGKSDKSLSDTSRLDKQRSQLEELEQRRQQLEMLHDWHSSLIGIDEQAADLAADLWFKSTHRDGLLLTNEAKEELRRLIKRNGFDAVCKAIREAADAVERSAMDHRDACCEWFWKIGRIVSTNKIEAKDPGTSRLLYIRGILRKRCPYLNESWCIALLKQAKDAGMCLDWMESFAKQVTSWSQFRDVVSETLNKWQIEDEEATDGTHP